MESINDLLDKGNSAKQVLKFEPIWMSVTNESEVMSLLRKAESNRTVAATACNERSSRSHSILQIKLGQVSLSLIDLAGSERIATTKVEGDRLKETQAINKSLSALADVISAMKAQDNATGHIPDRNSKLTHLLQPSLASQSAKVLMIVNLNPISLNESLCSLRFAAKGNSS